MDPRYQPQFDPASGQQGVAEPRIDSIGVANESFVESRLVRSAEDEKMLRAMKPKKGESQWFESVGDLPPIEDGPDEDPSVTIANLRGQIEALERKTGRSAKAE